MSEEKITVTEKTTSAGPTPVTTDPDQASHTVASKRTETTERSGDE